MSFAKWWIHFDLCPKITAFIEIQFNFFVYRFYPLPVTWHDNQRRERILDRWIAFDNSLIGSNKNIQKPNLWPSFKHLFQSLSYEKQCQGTFERLTSLIPPPLSSAWVCPAGQTRHPPPCKLKRMIHYCCWSLARSKGKSCRCPLGETSVWTCYHHYM